MIYIIDGQLQFNEEDKIANKGDMIYFDQSSDEVQLTSISEKGSYLVLAGKPLKEPVARYGPFVANSEREIKQAMIDLYPDIKDHTDQILLVLQVHDELVFDVPVDEVAQLEGLIEAAMADAVKLAVPLVVDMSTGQNWLEAH